MCPNLCFYRVFHLVCSFYQWLHYVQFNLSLIMWVHKFSHWHFKKTLHLHFQEKIQRWRQLQVFSFVCSLNWFSNNIKKMNIGYFFFNLFFLCRLFSFVHFCSWISFLSCWFLKFVEKTFRLVFAAFSSRSNAFLRNSCSFQ